MSQELWPLPAFSEDEYTKAHRLLALKVALMMGRKLEEDDWTSVYCAAKGIPRQPWSNLHVDVMHNALGVEHKMLCYRSKPSLLQACGTRLMHPAATRSLRINGIDTDPNDEMRNIFAQYANLIELRRKTVAERTGVQPEDVDLRIGWLLWQSSLREFLYFEEQMTAPDPDDFYAQWTDSPEGARKGSRNLWIYEKSTGRKKFSLTTSAGIKLQPYFDVPAPTAAGLYHWVVIGEQLKGSDIRIWVTRRTLTALSQFVKPDDPTALSDFILRELDSLDQGEIIEHEASDEDQIVPLLIDDEAYSRLATTFQATNDDHLIQLLLENIDPGRLAN